ncbi:CinA family protein [Aurantivibrio plasticivorans]
MSDLQLISEKAVTDLADHLIGRRWCVTTAESCTGGGVAHAFTAVPGSSTWFEAGYVTYSNRIKNKLLGVHQETLERLGAVSEAVVKEMVAGALSLSDAEVGVAISGIAGPDGGSPEKPVGTVWFAWQIKGQSPEAERCFFKGDRDHVRQQAIEHAISGLNSILLKTPV